MIDKSSYMLSILVVILLRLYPDSQSWEINIYRTLRLARHVPRRAQTDVEIDDWQKQSSHATSEAMFWPYP